MSTLVRETIKADILLVDDRADQLVALQSVVADLEQNIVTARSGREALRHLLHHDFAVIILDVNMPGMDGYETAALIRERKNSEHTPIIFVSAYASTETHISLGYSLGAVDYIQRPVVPEVLRAKVLVFVELHKKSEELRLMQEAEHRRRLEETQLMLEVQTKRNLFFVLSIDLLCIAGFDGYFKQLNPAWQKTLGFQEDELKARPLLEFVHPEDRATTQEQLRKVEAGTPLTYFENRFLCEDGSYKWLGWTAAPFTPGELVYIFARDMTESRLLQEERAHHLLVEQRRAARLRYLAGASIAISSALAIDEMLDVVTDQARRMLEAHRAIGCISLDSNWSKAYRSKSRSEAYYERGDLELESQIEQQLRNIAAPLRLSAADLGVDSTWGALAGNQGSGMLNCICAPLTGRKGGTVGYIQVCDKQSGDFTSEDEFLLVQLAQMASLAIMNALYFEAREANRMKDEFLATLSHELRTPLTAILGWTWLLRSQETDPAGLPEALEIIERNARAQAKLIDDMLDISRIISGKLRLNWQQVRFQSQVEAAVDALRPAAQSKSIRLELSVDPQLGAIAGDPDRLHQVVSNLVSNAIKFTPADGKVDVQVESDLNTVRLAVRDTGIGIAQDFLPHVFERFRQADAGSTRPQGGLGLGLAIVRHLVELHGGCVRVESDGEGKGATFTIELPFDSSSAAEGDVPAVSSSTGHDEHAASQGPTALAGLNILVVDDDADSRNTIAMVLRQFGAEVIEVGSVAEAMTVFAAESKLGKLDVLVSDIAMPGEDGCSLIRRVRQHEAGSPDRLPAVAVTAFAREEDRARALEAGFQAHLSKPVAPAQLIAAISALVAQRSTS